MSRVGHIVRPTSLDRWLEFKIVLRLVKLRRFVPRLLTVKYASKLIQEFLVFKHDSIKADLTCSTSKS
jgi:hypothetical protein